MPIAKNSRLVCLLLLAFLSASAVTAEVVINEIQYDPGDNMLKTEFIEILNPGQVGIELSGWSLANAVNFTFPNGTQLAAGRFLIIAEDPDAIFSEYGVFAMGPYEGKLSNDGEHLELHDDFGGLQDEVEYQVKFPWPQGSAGEGKSMSLINPSLDNDLGGSWRAAVPTPGITNADYSALSPPAIRQVNHTPKQPKSNELIVITAKVTDPEGVQSARVLYQTVSPGNYIPSEFPLTHNQLLATPDLARTPNPAFENATNWTEVPMADDGLGSDAIAGDSIFTGIIPGQTNRTLVRYRLVARDAAIPSSSVQVPHADDPSLNFACFVEAGCDTGKNTYEQHFFQVNVRSVHQTCRFTDTGVSVVFDVFVDVAVECFAKNCNFKLTINKPSNVNVKRTSETVYGQLVFILPIILCPLGVCIQNFI